MVYIFYYYSSSSLLYYVCSSRRESALILYAGFIRGAALGFMIVFVNIVMFITVTAFVTNGGKLTSKGVFTTISLLINLRLTSVHFFVQNILGIVEAQVAARRLQVNIVLTVLLSWFYSWIKLKQILGIKSSLNWFNMILGHWDASIWFRW